MPPFQVEQPKLARKGNVHSFSARPGNGLAYRGCNPHVKNIRWGQTHLALYFATLVSMAPL
jgi:hypothetical protein